MKLTTDLAGKEPGRCDNDNGEEAAHGQGR